MILTVLRSRLRPEAEADYIPMAQRLSALAKTMPGYIAHKVFVADDGERLTLVEFESEEGMRAWGVHPEHVEAKRLGRRQFFSNYRVQVCTVVRDSQTQPVRPARHDAGPGAG
jgi:heme-degrading monooxygenase HmoA